MFLRSFVDVFEYSSVWGGPDYPGFYLCGSDQPKREMLGTIQQAYADPVILADLNEWDPLFGQPEEFLNLYLCDGQELKNILRDVPMVTDDRPYTEFPLWRACFDHKHYPVFINAIQLKHVLAGSRGPG